jgi:hypothetical protein
LLSIEISGVTLPAEFVDPETGRCCVLLGHLGDPDVPRGFNVTVAHQHQWILQSVLFVPARLLTFAQCQMIRKEGAEARRKLGETFVKGKTFHVCDVPANLWPKIVAATGAAASSASLSKDAVVGVAATSSASSTMSKKSN